MMFVFLRELDEYSFSTWRCEMRKCETSIGIASVFLPKIAIVSLREIAGVVVNE